MLNCASISLSNEILAFINILYLNKTITTQSIVKLNVKSTFTGYNFYNVLPNARERRTFSFLCVLLLNVFLSLFYKLKLSSKYYQVITLRLNILKRNLDPMFKVDYRNRKVNECLLNINTPILNSMRCKKSA